MFGKK